MIAVAPFIVFGDAANPKPNMPRKYSSRRRGGPEGCFAQAAPGGGGIAQLE